MSKFNCVVIGYGVVGHNLAAELAKLKPHVVDKYKPELTTATESHYDVGFVCVDTPLGKDGILDWTEVENAIRENDCSLYVIKSTVPVGTTHELRQRLGKRIVFSPEYYGGTQHCNNFEFAFTILGGTREDCVYCQQMLQRVYDARHRFYLVDSRTAEMAKFMENAWLATKVSFCCEFFRAAQNAGVDYEILRELFVADPRVNPSHTFVYRDAPYYDSHCLNKDVPSVANQFGMELLLFMEEMNKKNKERH